jgi:hypothetical protein
MYTTVAAFYDTAFKLYHTGPPHREQGFSLTDI